MRRRCKHCGDDTGTPDFDTCGRCAVLLEGLDDVTIDPPPGAPPQVLAPGREPGSDDLAEDEEARRSAVPCRSGRAYQRRVCAGQEASSGPRFGPPEQRLGGNPPLTFLDIRATAIYCPGLPVSSVVTLARSDGWDASKNRDD